MEFDEMKKIWDTQNNQVLYAIDEAALHARVMSKKRRAGHTANITECLLIVVNLAAGVFVVTVHQFDERRAAFFYLMSAWTILTALFVIFHRVRRVNGENRFDRTILGDLDHAISNASYQVRLSHLMRWNGVPIALFILLGFWEVGTPVWIAVLVLIFLGLAYYASGWEHGIYKNRKHELEALRAKLADERTFPAD